jgi:hypothetical protein
MNVHKHLQQMFALSFKKNIMANLTITRPKSMIGKLRNYTLFIDGKEYGNIQNGETVNLELLQGEHRIKTRKSFSNEFSNEILINLGNNETKKLEIGFSKFWLWFYLIFTVMSTVAVIIFYNTLQDLYKLAIVFTILQYTTSLFFKKRPEIELNIL